MVGVPGKYKGCETCRKRRVTCDNTKPLCRKCLDSGRKCGGYQRDLVFITATVADGGRCSSHPRRVITPTPSSSKKSKSPESEDGLQSQQQQQQLQQNPSLQPEFQLVASQPLTPAWHDHIRLSSQTGAEYLVQFAGLHTNLQGVVHNDDGDDCPGQFKLMVPQYSPAELLMPMMEEEFDTPSQCLVHLLPMQGDEAASTSLCVFLYQHDHSAASTANIPPWRLDPNIMCGVRRMGSEAFKSFPNHHFFVRVYRPSAISVALLNRKETFLAAPEWNTVPWEMHEKSVLDRLFDIVVLLPSIFCRTDRLVPGHPTQERRLRAQDLLSNCLYIERQFDDWYSSMVASDSISGNGSFWLDGHDMQAQIPFAGSFVFQDGVSAMAFIYYWMSLMLFHRTIEQLHRIIFQPVMESYPNMYPDLPSNLMINEMKYQQGRDLAAKICRSLDFALNHTAQPDLLVAPLWIVHDFYGGINQATRDGELEILWCGEFRGRLLEKGQQLSNVICGGAWAEIAKF